MGETKHKLKASDFVHLHNHTEYSLLDGLTKVSDLVKYVKSLGMESVAMTDHGTLSGAVDFYKEAKGHGVRPIIGIEAYVAERKHTDKDPAKDKNRYHLILLAADNTGYQNLMRLSTIANLEGYYYYPRVDRALLEKYNEGLIVLSGCMGGELGDALKRDDIDKARQVAKWYKRVFGDRYYLEVQDHGHPKNPMTNPEQQAVNEAVLKLSDELDIPAVVTCDAHYLKHEDQDAHEILLCVGTGSYLSDAKRMTLKDFPLHVTEPKEIIERWGKDYPQLISNTRVIAERCNVELRLGQYLIPKFPVPKSHTEKSYLEKLTYEGLAARYIPDKKPAGTVAGIKKLLPAGIVERADFELGVINGMAFDGYFLIVADFINWGKDRGIVFGPGRGSGAGSIVAYGLRITELDPIKYDLLFERFLNPDRISMPDFDVDIQDTRRDEVIQYCVDKYGKDRVANIVTFGRMFARNAVRDVSRVLQVPYAEADRLAKMIPPPVQGRHIPLEKSLKENPDLKAEYKSNETSRRVLDFAVKLESTVRSHGVHAAGVVIAPDDIVKFTPLEMAQKGVVATQYPMGPIEDLGLLKMDFLGLSNLTIIKNALRIVKKVHGHDIDIAELPLDDEATYKLFQKGDTTGVFQFESSGMRRYLKELKPTLFDDLIAMVALYRPGPLTAGLTDKFIARKNGREKVSYDHKLMEASLKNTYGVIVYQEQVMQIARDMCGFTGGESDTLRKAVGKKIRSMMAEMKDKIIQGALKNGVDKKVAEKFWSDLEGFADYAFNKSHAACYALIAYQTAYLKANYPEAFMAALMTSDYNDTDRLAIEITECQHMGIEVLPPDVNESFAEFAVVPGEKQIRFGMVAVKNVGKGVVEEIERVRQENGHFGSLEDFLSTVNLRIVNRKAMESLIKAGAFDKFEDRRVLIANLDSLMSYAARLQKERTSGQTDLFGEASDELFEKPKLELSRVEASESNREYMEWERELLGLYLSEHPLAEHQDFLEKHAHKLGEITTSHDGSTIQAGGNVVAVREITTKNGKKMAFVRIADLSGEIEVIIFPGFYDKVAEKIQRDKVVFIKGKVSTRDRNGNPNGELKLVADDIKEIDEVKKKGAAAVSAVTATASSIPQNPKLYVKIINSEDHDLLLNLRAAIASNTGDTEVVLVLGEGKSKQAIKLPMRFDANEDNFRLVVDIVGADNAKLS